MEEQIALAKIQIPLLATKGDAPLVRQFEHYKKYSDT
jgi:hypothetical protein